MPWLDLEEELEGMFSGLAVSVAVSEQDGYSMRTVSERGRCHHCGRPEEHKSLCDRCRVFNNLSILARRRWRRARGLCTKCRKPPIGALPGRSLCLLCTSSRSKYEISAREKCLAVGVCTRCKGPRDDSRKPDCQSCRTRAVSRARDAKVRNRAAGRCDCGRARDDGRKQCSVCRQRKQEYKMRKAVAKVEEVLN